MKKLIISTFVMTFFIACRNETNDCECTQQRWERTAYYSLPNGSENQGSPTFISADAWNPIGVRESINIDDCSKNGTLGENGYRRYFLSDGTLGSDEFEYRISCE